MRDSECFRDFFRNIVVVGLIKKMKIDLARTTVFLQTLEYNFAELTTGTVFKNYLGLLLGLNNDLM
jgi:hypothetical protein